MNSKVNSDHFIIAGGLTVPSSSEGLIYKKDYLVGYIPIASITKVYSQYRSNIFDVALANDGSVHGVNIPSSAYGAECIILFVKNKSFSANGSTKIECIFERLAPITSVKI